MSGFIGSGLGDVMQPRSGGANPISAADACWTYRGPATMFVGKFSSGQAVSARMMGEATDYNPRNGSAATVLRPRDPNVEGPGGYFFAVPDAPGV